jgi:fatty acid desaturase
MSTKPTPTTKLRPQDVLSTDEITQFTQRSDLMGWWAVLSTWAVIAATLSIFIYSLEHASLWVSIVVGLLALIILAGRQLCLGILTHDAAHSTLFASRKLNDWVGDWLCAKPVWNSLHDYRPYHLQHHAHTSTDLDPDLSLVAGLPTTRASLSRKFIRDLVGITGIKFLIGRVLMDLGIFKWSVTNHVERLPQEGRVWWNYPVCFCAIAMGCC